MEKNKHLGSSLDNFLEEEGILEEIVDVVKNRVHLFSLKLEKEKKKKKKLIAI